MRKQGIKLGKYTERKLKEAPEFECIECGGEVKQYQVGTNPNIYVCNTFGCPRYGLFSIVVRKKGN